MQRYWLVAVVFIIILAAVLMNRQEAPQVGSSSNKEQKQEKATSEGQLAGNDDSAEDEDTEAEEQEEAVASNDHILLVEPSPNTLAASPFTVRGKARGITGDVLTVRIVSQDGTVAISETVRVYGGDEKSFGTFEIKNLSYAFTSGEEKTLEVFAKGEQGEDLYKLSIPLRFTLTK